VTLTPAEMVAIEHNLKRHQSMGGHEINVEPDPAPEVTARARTTKYTGATIHILIPDWKYTGKRIAVWNLIQDGMKVTDLFAECARRGLEAKATLQKFQGYGCVEVRQP
jgi:hypothetical protein